MTALNGLQTSADVLEIRRDQKKRCVNHSLAEQRRLDEHHHRVPKAKLQHTREFMERSGICTVSWRNQIRISVLAAIILTTFAAE